MVSKMVSKMAQAQGMSAIAGCSVGKNSLGTREPAKTGKEGKGRAATQSTSLGFSSLP